MSDLQHRIRLIEISNEASGEHGVRRKIVMAFQPREDSEPVVTMAWRLEASGYDDEALVPLARHYFQDICARLAEASADWRLDDDQLEHLKRQRATRPPQS